MTGIRAVFVDTGAYIALADRSDRHHPDAVLFSQQLGPRPERLTSWGVVAEAYTWLRYHGSASRAAAWLSAFERLCAAGETRMVFPDGGLDALCRRKLLKFSG